MRLPPDSTFFGPSSTARLEEKTQIRTPRHAIAYQTLIQPLKPWFPALGSLDNPVDRIQYWPDKMDLHKPPSH